MISWLENDRKFNVALILAALFGLFAGSISITVVGILFFIIALVQIFSNKNKNGEAHLFAVFFTSFELFSRMGRSFLPHEISKYTIVILISAGLLFTHKRRNSNGLIILFILLFLPSITLIDTSDKLWIQVLVTTILGPIAIGMSILYFFNYQINKIDIINISRAFLIPMIAIVAYLFGNGTSITSLSEVSSLSSNAELAGNYGPNQVSVMMGAAYGILLFSYFFNYRIIPNKLLEIGLLLATILRGFLTFSRGGVIVPMIAFVLCMVLIIMRSREKKYFKKIIPIVFIGISIYGIFALSNLLTNDSLSKRYKGETALTEKTGEVDNLSGRDQIMIIDLEIFRDNLLIGVGPGMAKSLRYYYGFSTSVSAHIEFSRILAEHGLLGLFAIIIYIISFLGRKSNWKEFPEEHFFLLFIWWIGFLTSNHNSLRLGATCIFLGMVFSKITLNPNYFTKKAKKFYPELDESSKPMEAAPMIATSEPGN